jgi:hypothetical protein
LPNATQRIWIEATGLGGRGQRYRVTHNGVLLIGSTKNPEFDSARALLARGIVGQVEVWRHDVNYPAMRFDVEKAAKLTIEESAGQARVSSAGSRVLRRTMGMRFLHRVGTPGRPGTKHPLPIPRTENRPSLTTPLGQIRGCRLNPPCSEDIESTE